MPWLISRWNRFASAILAPSLARIELVYGRVYKRCRFGFTNNAFDDLNHILFTISWGISLRVMPQPSYTMWFLERFLLPTGTRCCGFAIAACLSMLIFGAGNFRWSSALMMWLTLAVLNPYNRDISIPE